jgi:hypothetical protein
MKNQQGFNRIRLFASIGITVPMALLAIFLSAPGVMAQTATSGTVFGTVTDPTGAVVPGAEVQLVNIDTNATSTQKTNSSGQYTFPNLGPGDYKITVKMAGFRTSSVPNVTVEVNKTTNQSIALEVGIENQVVEVTSSAVAQLQTSDAQIGNSITSDLIQRLPTLQRNITELMNLQPGVYSTGNGAANSGGNLQMRTAGAIDDQNTVTVDGIDITQGVVAANTVVPVSADSVEEFRSNVSNPNASFERSSGGQITLVTRHGTNQLHGAAYWYRQDSVLNANTWDNNRAKIAKPNIEDNRYGGNLGGPIIKNKTFIFGNFEGRMFDAVTQVTRTVPTDSLKQGILRFTDQAGTVQSYNLTTASVCGAAGNQACDPRGIGISPTVKALWALMPAGNIAGGDSLNTTGYLANIGTPTKDDYGVVRLDHAFSSRLNFNGGYTYFREIATGSGGISIINGDAQSRVSNPRRGSVTTASLTWQIRPTLLNAFRFGYVHDTNASQATSPTIGAGILSGDNKVPGMQTSAGPVALLVGSGVSTFIDSPIDMDTQRARYQANYNGDWQYIDDLNWIKGSHSFQFGGQFRKLPYTHVRADKVVGSLSSLAGLVDAQGGFLTIPQTNQPITCSASVTANCLKSADLTTWNRLYASTLGLLDNVNILAVRDAQLKPTPFGTNLVNITNQYATYFYGQDTWRMTKSFTLNYGLSYGFQTPPKDIQGRQTVQIDVGTGKLVNATDYMAARLDAATKGTIFNPTLGWVPVETAKADVFNIDYGNLAPRISFAWNPAGDGFLSRIMGDRKTVIRGGFAMVYDRTNIVQSVLIPMLGVGFGQTINIQLPNCAAANAAGKSCNSSLGSANPGASAFRVGVDGTIPLPPFGSSTSPVIPSRPFGETLSFQDDPNNKVGRSYNIDLSIQRQLPGGLVVEGAFVGRYARRLPHAVNFTQSPYMQLDTASGQTFAQAFDAIATTLRAGGTPANQPFFENQFPGIAAKLNATGTSTAAIVAANRNNFINGNVSNLFQNFVGYRSSIGLPAFTNDEAQTEFMRTYIGQSNYNGLLVTVSKRLSHGLQFYLNYTFSKAMDDGVLNQNQAAFYRNSFHPGTEYGPSGFDRTHVFNALYVYAIPLGKGHKLSGGKFLERFLGGWNTSGILTALSGVPLFVTESSQVWGDDAILGAATGMIPTAQLSTGLRSGVAPATGIASAGGGANGTGLNLFSDPVAAYNSFRPILLATDTRSGRANPFRGLGFKNFDMSVSKDTTITERLKGRISFDFFNLFNHPNFRDPTLNYQTQGSFGVVTSSFIPPNRTNGARWIQIGLRLDF